MNAHISGAPMTRDCPRCGSAGSIEFSMCQVCLWERRAFADARRIVHRTLLLEERPAEPEPASV